MVKKHNHSHAPDPERDLTRIRVSITTLLRDRIGSPYPPWRRPDCPLPVTQKEVEYYLQSVLDTSAVLARIQKRRGEVRLESGSIEVQKCWGTAG